MQRHVTVARLPREDWLARKFALLTTTEALRRTAGLMRECFFKSDPSEYEKILGLLHDVERLNGADAAHALVGLKKTSLFFLEFGLAIYGLRLKRM